MCMLQQIDIMYILSTYYVLWKNKIYWTEMKMENLFVILVS